MRVTTWASMRCSSQAAKVRAADKFNQGYLLTELLAYHPDSTIEARAVELLPKIEDYMGLVETLMLAWAKPVRRDAGITAVTCEELT